MVLSLTEKPDTSALGWVAQHPDIWHDDVELLRNYARQCLENDGELEVEYQRKGLGRFYAADTRIKSCTTQWRKVRSTLFHDNHIDLDIISCHPRICRELLNRASIDIPQALDDFCQDKDAWLATQKLSKSQAKALFCAMINGGSLGSAEIRKNLDIPHNWVPCGIWVDTAEALTIAMVELFQHPETKVLLGRIAEASPEVEVGVMHKSLAHVYQYYETEHMIQVMSFLKKAHVVFSAYCYDGCVIHKDYLDIIKRWIKSGCKLPLTYDPTNWSSVLQFKTKPFGELLEEPKYDFSDAEFMRLAKPDTEDEAGCKAVLPKLKLYFERYCCLVNESQELVMQTGPGQYMRFKGGDRNSVTCALQYPIWTQGHVGYKPWFNYWLKDCTKRKVKGWDYAPPPRVCKPNHLDLWSGFTIAKHPQSSIELDTSIIHDHLKYLCEDSTEGLDYILNWLAFIMQKPGIPTGVAVAFSGVQGCGKSEFWITLMRALMGHDKTMVTASWDNVFGRFNSRAGKSFILCDEMDGFDSHKGANAMKEAITETTCNSEKKGKDTITLPAACNYIIATNSVGNILKIESSDRRYIPFRIEEIKKRSHYDQLFAAIEDKSIVRCFYDELMTRDIVGFQPQRDRVTTESYEELKEVNISHDQLFINAWRSLQITELNDHIWYSSTVIYNAFRKWCTEEEHIPSDRIMAKRSFCMRVSSIVKLVEGIDKEKHGALQGYNVWDDFFNS